MSQKKTKSKANQDFSEIYNINSEEGISIYNSFHNSKISNKIKEFCYKIFHRYLPTKSLLYKMNIIDTPRCNFCQIYNQTTKHLFLDCFESNLWFCLKDFIYKEFSITIDFTSKIKVFGLRDHLQIEHVILSIFWLLIFYPPPSLLLSSQICKKNDRFNQMSKRTNACFRLIPSFLADSARPPPPLAAKNC